MIVMYIPYWFKVEQTDAQQHNDMTNSEAEKVNMEVSCFVKCTY